MNKVVELEKLNISVKDFHIRCALLSLIRYTTMVDNPEPLLLVIAQLIREYSLPIYVQMDTPVLSIMVDENFEAAETIAIHEELVPQLFVFLTQIRKCKEIPIVEHLRFNDLPRPQELRETIAVLCKIFECGIKNTRKAISIVIASLYLHAGFLPEYIGNFIKAGPLFDGDCPSKSQRDMMLNAGLCIRVTTRESDFSTAATPLASSVYDILLELEKVHQFK